MFWITIHGHLTWLFRTFALNHLLPPITHLEQAPALPFIRFDLRIFYVQDALRNLRGRSYCGDSMRMIGQHEGRNYSGRYLYGWPGVGYSCGLKLTENSKNWLSLSRCDLGLCQLFINISPRFSRPVSRSKLSLGLPRGFWAGWLSRVHSQPAVETGRGLEYEHSFIIYSHCVLWLGSLCYSYDRNHLLLAQQLLTH